MSTCYLATENSFERLESLLELQNNEIPLIAEDGRGILINIRGSLFNQMNKTRRVLESVQHQNIAEVLKEVELLYGMLDHVIVKIHKGAGSLRDLDEFFMSTKDQTSELEPSSDSAVDLSSDESASEAEA